jgi:hypothetical protein
VRFRAFLGKGKMFFFGKNTTKMFLQKVHVHVENFSQKNRQNFRCQFPSTFFYRGFGRFSAMGVQKHYKKRFPKKILSKSFNKKFDQKSKTDFLSVFFYDVFGRFSVRGVQKHHIKTSGKKSDPGPFLASDLPTHHGGYRFFWALGRTYQLSDTIYPPFIEIF